jgi:hypothetical protein
MGGTLVEKFMDDNVKVSNIQTVIVRSKNIADSLWQQQKDDLSHHLKAEDKFDIDKKLVDVAQAVSFVNDNIDKSPLGGDELFGAMKQQAVAREDARKEHVGAQR